MNAQQLRACRARHQQRSTGDESDSDPSDFGAAPAYTKRNETRSAAAVAVVASESEQGSRCPRRGAKRSAVVVAVVFAFLLKQTLNQPLTRSPERRTHSLQWRQGRRTRRFSTTVRSSSTEVQNTCTLLEQGRETERGRRGKAMTQRNVFLKVV